jgi:ribonuclease T2
MKVVLRILAALALLGSATVARAAEGEPGAFDYYVLALSWSPSFCESKGGSRPGEPQCSGDRPYSFVIHGLWPQYSRGWPQFCHTAERPWVPDRLIKDMIDVMPSKRLIINEYKKHGTCSGLNPTDYFAAARRAFEHIKIPARFKDPQGYVTMSPGDIEAEFLKANADLKPDMIAVACNSRKLSELRVCFSRELKLTACGPNEQQEKLCSSEKIVMPPVRAGYNQEPRSYNNGGYNNRGRDENDDDDRDDDDR